MFTVGSSPAAETAGLPAWITPELIAETIRVWQPYHAQPLSEREAVEMLLAAANLLDCLGKRREQGTPDRSFSLARRR